MARSEEKLSLTGLGISGNRPPDAVQPTLVDGVHLRWAFRTGLGFPWHGFYLYRRRHRRGPGKPSAGRDTCPVRDRHSAHVFRPLWGS